MKKSERDLTDLTDLISEENIISREKLQNELANIIIKYEETIFKYKRPNYKFDDYLLESSIAPYRNQWLEDELLKLINLKEINEEKTFIRKLYELLFSTSDEKLDKLKIILLNELYKFGNNTDRMTAVESCKEILESGKAHFQENKLLKKLLPFEENVLYDKNDLVTELSENEISRAFDIIPIYEYNIECYLEVKSRSTKYIKSGKYEGKYKFRSIQEFEDFVNFLNKYNGIEIED